MATTNFKGQPVKLIGEFIQVGKVAPDFELVKTDLSSFSLKDLNGKNVILNIFPSLDTSVPCSRQIRRPWRGAILLCAAFPAPEPRLILGRGIADADARIGLEREVPPVVLDPEFRAGRDIAVVERLVDLQSPGQLAGAVRAVCARADEHGLRLVHVPGHDVEHPVHAVAEVDYAIPTLSSTRPFTSQRCLIKENIP